MFTATCPLGLEDLLQDELVALGAHDARRAPGAVHFDGPLEAALKTLLWARLPSRVLMTLARFEAHDRTSLYEGVKALSWDTWLHPSGTLSVHCARGEGALHHTHFAALVVKDAVVDALRARTGSRPTVDTTAPDARLMVHIKRGVATLSFDLSGDSLHRRGYREGGGEAPLKENVAAAVLLRSGWPHKAAPHHGLVDPMCGSGTLLIEGALMALGVPANGHRKRFGVDGFRALDTALWQRLRQEADQKRTMALSLAPTHIIRGYDIDDRQLQVARRQAHHAGVHGHIRFAQQDVAQLAGPPHGAKEGCLVVNPPFGARIGGTEADVRALMETLGEALTRLPHYSWHVLVADEAMGFATGLVAQKRHSIMHGPLACTLLHLKTQRVKEAPASQDDGPPGAVPTIRAQPLQNRLRKNLRALGAYLEQGGITAYRLYDHDLPEYAVAIDVYTDVHTGRAHVHVQEYAAPKEVPEGLAQARLRQVLRDVSEVLFVPTERMALKVRRRQRLGMAYGRNESQRLHKDAAWPRAKSPRGSDGFFVQEGGINFYVDLHTYVDSGLFLDHRKVRAWVRKHSHNKRFLNLFGYTGSVSLAAAMGGAMATTTVDMSRTYLDWAAHNFAANGQLVPRHAFIQADCIAWLERTTGPLFDLAFVNPPTHSNSKRMEEDFDIVRDHGALLRQTMRLVARDGAALFSTHAKKLAMDEALKDDFVVTELTRKLTPKDFDRAKRGCRAWLLRHRPAP